MGTLLLFSAPVAVRNGFASAAPVQSFNPKEPARPAMITSVPGPKSQELLKELNAIQVSATLFCLAVITSQLESIQPRTIN